MTEVTKNILVGATIIFFLPLFLGLSILFLPIAAMYKIGKWYRENIQ